MLGRRIQLRFLVSNVPQAKDDITGYDNPEAIKVNRFQSINYPENECRFCRYLSSSTSGQADLNTPWLATECYSAFVSIGSLVPGWSLIVPKAHTTNLAAEYNRADFWKFAGDAASVIEDKFGQLRVFEHGAFDESSNTGCGTGHAHLHMVPLPYSLIDEAINFDANLKWEDCLATDIHKKTRNTEYLYVADEYRGSLTLGKICLLKTQTSQFFRKVIANKMGISSSYDYKVFPMPETAIRSREILLSSKYLADEKSSAI